MTAKKRLRTLAPSQTERVERDIAVTGAELEDFV
jgi:hypothetical protein